MKAKFTLKTEAEFCAEELEDFYNSSETTEQSHKNKEVARNRVSMKRSEYNSLRNEFNKISDKICNKVL